MSGWYYISTITFVHCSSSPPESFRSYTIITFRMKGIWYVHFVERFETLSVRERYLIKFTNKHATDPFFSENVNILLSDASTCDTETLNNPSSHNYLISCHSDIHLFELNSLRHIINQALDYIRRNFL